MTINTSLYTNVTCVTNHPVALTSPDHICPIGTVADNHSNEQYVQEVEQYVKTHMNKDQFNYMDIGCAGGQLAVDFALRGHFSVGLEGSDHSIQRQLHNWPEYHKTVLHTTDLVQPYHVEKDNEKVLFDVISAWEVVEHIHPTQLDQFFNNVFANLKDDGIFIASINTGLDYRELPNGEIIHLHQSVFSEEHWRQCILNKFNVQPYPFTGVVRTMANYFIIMIKK
jgi:2-polyprenyl-3-methyl-5-hydroxy-6-metoxy-1,4-benzoquinol methylase